MSFQETLQDHPVGTHMESPSSSLLPFSRDRSVSGNLELASGSLARAHVDRVPWTEADGRAGLSSPCLPRSSGCHAEAGGKT